MGLAIFKNRINSYFKLNYMKKLFFIIAIMTLSVPSFAQVRMEALVKPGSKLIYAVEANGQHYDFIVTIKALTPALVFDWQMTDPVNTSGTITHTAAAMVSANTMYNYFSSGEKTLDDNTLSVWLSKNTHTALTKGGKSVMIKMNTNESLRKMGVPDDDKDDDDKDDEDEIKIIVNGEKETIAEEIAKPLNEEGQPMGEDIYFSFYNSSKMPVILRMKNGFAITLKEIKTK
jgi:hypothetical protein